MSNWFARKSCTHALRVAKVHLWGRTKTPSSVPCTTQFLVLVYNATSLKIGNEIWIQWTPIHWISWCKYSYVFMNAFKIENKTKKTVTFGLSHICVSSKSGSSTDLSSNISLYWLVNSKLSVESPIFPSRVEVLTLPYMVWRVWLTEILETFQRVFRFEKSRIKENGGKSLLRNVLGNKDNYLNVNYLIEYFVKLTWYVVYTSSCNFSLFQITKSLVLEFICKVFLSVCFCISSFLFFLCNLITPLVKVLSCLD